MDLRREDLEKYKKTSQRESIKVRARSEGGRKTEGEYWKEGE